MSAAERIVNEDKVFDEVKEIRIRKEGKYWNVINVYFEKMDQWIEEDNDRFRQHLGMSGIGDDDERKSWLNFRWSLPSPFKGRMLRLFDRAITSKIKW